MKVMAELFNVAWASQDVITVDHVTDLTLTINKSPFFVLQTRCSMEPAIDSSLRHKRCRCRSPLLDNPQVFVN